MAVVSYRLYCTDCDRSIVVKDKWLDEHPWRVKSKVHHDGLCPHCNDGVDEDSVTYPPFDDELDFAELDAIGETGADNLREKGIVTRSDVQDASDEEILDTAWVGNAGLESIRKEVQ